MNKQENEAGAVEKLLRQILNLIDTACQAALEMLSCLEQGKIEELLKLSQGIDAIVQSVVRAQVPIMALLEHAYTSEMLENVAGTLEDIQNAVNEQNMEHAAMKVEFQLFPFLRQLKEAFYFWGMVYPEKERMDRYYREEFAEHYRNFYISEEEQSRYQLSIVVTAYNHLDVTKRCVEQLLKETDFEALNAELILIDHGSTDGTLEYFEGLGIGKVIHFKRNVRMYMFTSLFQICQGKYFAFVSNDILVTKNWADNLLLCMESDHRIAVAVPTTPNISNRQMIDFPTDDPQEFINWAATQNQSDPKRWNDRARVLPSIACYNTAVINQIGLADPYFYTMEFWDDDFSLRARRSGYRLLVCDDVACYHFGSVTGNEAQKHENTLYKGRQLFQEKHGIDPWAHDFCYDANLVHFLTHGREESQDATVLCIDGGFGDSALQVCNQLRHSGGTCSMYHLTMQKEYQENLEQEANQFGFSETTHIGELVKNSFDDICFSHVFIGRDIAEYENYQELLDGIKSKMRPGGRLVFTLSNPFSIDIISDILSLTFPTNQEKICFLCPEQVSKSVREAFTQVQIVNQVNELDGIDFFIHQHWPQYPKEQVKGLLSVDKYYYVCMC